MQLYVLTDEAGYIYASSPEMNLVNCIEIDVPDDFNVPRQHEYRLEGGNLVYDQLPEPAPAPDPIQQRLDEQEAAIIELAGLIAGGGL